MEQRQTRLYAEHRNTAELLYFSCAPTIFNRHEYENISHICTKKSKDTVLYKAPFCLFFPSFFTKTILDM